MFSSGEIEVRRMWVLPRARHMMCGKWVFPWARRLLRGRRLFLGTRLIVTECMIIGLLLYKTGISANSLEALSMYARFSVRLLDYIV